VDIILYITYEYQMLGMQYRSILLLHCRTVWKHGRSVCLNQYYRRLKQNRTSDSSNIPSMARNIHFHM